MSLSGGSRTRAWLAALSTATFGFSLVFSLYYVMHAETLHSRVTLRQRDDGFLNVFAGWNTDHEGDAAFYNRLALGVLQTGVPRNRAGEVSWYTPVYSYFLAGCYALGGVRQLSVTIPQSLLFGLTCCFVGLSAFRLGRSQAALLAAGILCLLNLRVAIYASYISPTILLLFLVSVGAYLASEPLRPKSAMLFAVVFCLGIFTQAGFAIVATAAAAWLIRQAYCQKQGTFLFGAALTLICVAGRVVWAGSAAEDGRPQRRENVSSIVWEANNPYYESMTLRSLWERRPGNPWTTWQVSEPQQQRYEQYLARAGGDRFRAALLWVRENPVQYSKLCLIRLRTTLGPYTGQMSPRNRLISTLYWLVTFPMGYYAWWRWRRLPVSRLAVMMFVLLTAFETLVITEWYLRYRLPWDLMLTVFAAAGYAQLLSRTRPERTP